MPFELGASNHGIPESVPMAFSNRTELPPPAKAASPAPPPGGPQWTPARSSQELALRWMTAQQPQLWAGTAAARNITSEQAYRKLRTIEECIGIITEKMDELFVQHDPPPSGWSLPESIEAADGWQAWSVERLFGVVHEERVRLENECRESRGQVLLKAMSMQLMAKAVPASPATEPVVEAPPPQQRNVRPRLESSDTVSPDGIPGEIKVVEPDAQAGLAAQPRADAWPSRVHWPSPADPPEPKTPPTLPAVGGHDNEFDAWMCMPCTCPAACIACARARQKAEAEPAAPTHPAAGGQPRGQPPAEPEPAPPRRRTRRRSESRERKGLPRAWSPIPGPPGHRAIGGDGAGSQDDAEVQGFHVSFSRHRDLWRGTRAS